MKELHGNKAPETKVLFQPSTGSLIVKMVQNALPVTFTFAKYSSQNGLTWAYKREGTEPGAVTFYCKNSGRPRWSCVPLPKATCFLFYSSIKWHLRINKISCKRWKPHAVGEQGLGDGNTHHHRQLPYYSCRRVGVEVRQELKNKIVGHVIINYIIK